MRQTLALAPMHRRRMPHRRGEGEGGQQCRDYSRERQILLILCIPRILLVFPFPRGDKEDGQAEE